MDGMPLRKCVPRQKSSAMVAADGRSILFMPCGLRSHNPNDIKHKYCAACGRYFDTMDSGESHGEN